MTKYHLSQLLSLAAITLMALCLAGCAGGDPMAAGREVPKPIPVKPPPPPKDVPVDASLQAEARQALEEAFKSTEPTARVHALEGLRRATGEAAAPQVLQALKDGNSMVRFGGAMAAGELRLAAARPMLPPLLNDPDPNVRVAARFALHRLGDTTYSHDLERTALDPDVKVRVATAMVFGHLGEPSAIRILRRMRVVDASAAVRQQAAESLWRLGDEQGLEDLTALAASKYPDDEMIGLLGLAARGDARVQEDVRAGLSADWDEVKLVAARALAMVSDEKGPYDLGYNIAMAGLKSSDPRQRLLGALALGAIGRTDAQDALRAVLKDADADARIAAATAILEIGKNPQNARG